MSKARERQKKRQQRRTITNRTGRQIRQIAPEGGFQMPRIRIPGGRWLLLIPLAIGLFVAVVGGLGLLNPRELAAGPNAIWLDDRWTQAERAPEDFAALAATLRSHGIGTAFAYVSSLREDNAWSGLGDGRSRFNEAEPIIAAFVEQFKASYPDANLYAWIEVSVITSAGDRLDSQQVHDIVASFSNRMVTQVGFDGVFLDVKPLFNATDDYLDMLRAVRAAIGLETPLIVAVPPDLTPTDTDLTLPPQILPDTVWRTEYKQRVALQADQLVVTAYNSYQTQPVDYIEWVAYQVQAYTQALTEMQTGATVLISVPDYAEFLPAHDVTVETLEAALDGVRRGLEIAAPLSDTPVVAGVAIFSDEALTEADWAIVRDKWLNR